MRDHSHTEDQDSGVCPHCGQPLPQAAPGFGERRPNRTAIAVTIAVHVLVLSIALMHKMYHQVSGAKKSEAIYIAPLAGKPSQPQPQPKQRQKKLEVADVQRLKNTITLPTEVRVQPVPVQEVKQKTEPSPKPVEEDMAAYIASRQKARGATQAAPGETDDERGRRNALANIAALNGKSGQDPNDTGGVFSVKTEYHSAELKFRGFNSNFKRRWLTQLTVEQGNEPDIETAVIKKMIELIRKEKKGDFIWESHRLGREVQLSARPEDTAQLMAFLMKEMYPEYRPPRR
ncbi:hypothetical protein [Massilia sp. TS11]|uniref:hypothetical protein n=1 Tax=Massilia sp. TS11 TaxID=2908003 RepID=UPI001EDC2314|nr:hypothetical protein [Massilia sp. TS11]MCG2584896.1 hypothetical protein [Massilia sp. TS11]